MGIHSDDILRKECQAYVEQFLVDAASGQASEIIFRPQSDHVQAYVLIDGKYQKGPVIHVNYFPLFRQILHHQIFATGSYRVSLHEFLCIFEIEENNTGDLKLKIVRRPIPNGRRDTLEDIFRAFEHPSWDAIKSIFLSILNLALAKHYDSVHMELKGPIVEVRYIKGGTIGTQMSISSDSYDSLVRLIGDNYLAFGFMTRKFRDSEYLIRLTELNDDEVAPRIKLEIEILD